MKHTIASLEGGRRPVRLPLSPLRSELALKALDEWRQPDEPGRERGWYKIANEAGAPVRVDIFDEISWWGISAQQFIDTLAQIEGPVEVHINSPGGDAFDGIAIYNALASRPGVTTVADGLVASAASVIYMAGQTRKASPGSMVMIHDALALCVGNAADMRDTAQLLDKVSDNIAGVYAAHTDTPAADWRKAMVAEGWYTADEAVAAGLAHQVTERPAGDGAAAAEASWDRSVFGRWHGRVGAKALAVHHTATVDEPWDGPAAVAAMPNDAKVLEYCHAWQDSASDDGDADDPDGDADDQKGSYKFPHHKTEGGPANLAGCRNGLARLEGSDIPAGDKEGVRAHLQAHLDDGEKAGNHAGPDLSGWDPDVFRSAFKGGMQ